MLPLLLCMVLMSLLARQPLYSRYYGQKVSTSESADGCWEKHTWVPVDPEKQARPSTAIKRTTRKATQGHGVLFFLL